MGIFVHTNCMKGVDLISESHGLGGPTGVVCLPHLGGLL